MTAGNNERRVVVVAVVVVAVVYCKVLERADVTRRDRSVVVGDECVRSFRIGKAILVGITVKPKETQMIPIEDKAATTVHVCFFNMT